METKNIHKEISNFQANFSRFLNSKKHILNEKFSYLFSRMNYSTVRQKEINSTPGKCLKTKCSLIKEIMNFVYFFLLYFLYLV